MNSAESSNEQPNNTNREPAPPEVWADIKKNPESVMAIFTMLIFAATAAYAVIATLQWCALLDSNKINRENVIAAQRPWLTNDGNGSLVITDVSEDALTGSFTFNVKNFGPSPALDVGQAIQLFVRTRGDMSEFDEAKKKACQSADAGAVVGGNSIFPQQTHNYSWEPSFLVPGLRKEIGVILIEGCLAYTDQFAPKRITHHTTFCVMGGIKNTGKLALCGYHEIAD